MEKLISGVSRLGLQFETGQLEQFEVFYRELTAWNKRINLTSITGYEEVQVNHFLDALTLVLAWQPPQRNNRLRIIDIGTGAGIPGIPLKIIFPDLRLVLLESTAKKAVFLKHLCEQLDIDDVEVVTGRAEEIAHREQYREQFELVLSRAVAPLPTLVELTLPFCTAGGIFIAYKKGDIETELEQARNAINILGGKLQGITTVDLPEFPGRRCLVVVDKISPTPDKYPRRPGMPSKRPLS
ncbi:MAG TPA: 16S rRNA (guanine(527)-N(7))-methyltransferase RsmG [Dehalococcoidia bacterium]|nr:16S rRNA (guanine(527)-N(7))-methyltransferase RsmG [Dehalococcoidia bacterium]